MNSPGEERVIEKTFNTPTTIGGVRVIGTVSVRQRLMVSGKKIVLGKELLETVWVDLEVVE